MKLPGFSILTLGWNFSQVRQHWSPHRMITKRSGCGSRLIEQRLLHLAEAQLGEHVAEFHFPLQTPNLEVPKTGTTKSSNINELKLLLDSPPSPLTPTPLKSSKHDGLSQDPIFQSQFPTQPTQMRDPHVSDPSIQEGMTENTISQTSFETTPTLLPTPHISSSSPGAAQSPSLGSSCEFKLHPFTQLFV